MRGIAFRIREILSRISATLLVFVKLLLESGKSYLHFCRSDMGSRQIDIEVGRSQTMVPKSDQLFVKIRKGGPQILQIFRGSDLRLHQRKSAAHVFELSHDGIRQQLALNYFNLSVDYPVEIRLSTAREGYMFPRVRAELFGESE